MCTLPIMKGEFSYDSHVCTRYACSVYACVWALRDSRKRCDSVTFYTCHIPYGM
jgi:hypothetical protein